MSAEAATLLKEQHAEEQVSWPGLGSAFLWTHRSPAKETPNEDGALAVRLDERRALLAVADGAGGHRAGDTASELAIGCLAETAERVARDSGEDFTGAALAAFDEAHRRIRGEALGAATTLLVLLVEGSTIRVLHVGDSKAVAFGGRGSIRLETISHSPVGYGVEAGLIGTDEAVGHEDLHVVSNLVGMEDMHVGVSSPVELRPLDRVLLASDGLYDNLAMEEIVPRLSRGDAARSVPVLAERCHERMEGGGHPDDLTLLLYRPVRS